ncbi:MAG: CTP synthase [Vampirovibrionales bacterium]
MSSTKYIFITGGVVSSLGKGIAAASLGRLLRARGYKVSIQKLDPYINVDPGTMSPFQHGEVFVTNDGAETDLDIGHYERFIDVSLARVNSVTSGSIYQRVIQKERAGEYLGGTVQVIPHITDEIKHRIVEASNTLNPDFLICEVGGTVGDIEGLPFLEAIRQFRYDVGFNNCCFLHVTLVPYLQTSGEAKTKPSQHSVNMLRSIGIQPDILVCRTEVPLGKGERIKLAQFTNIAPECVIEARTLKVLYEVPIALEEEGLTRQVLSKLDVPFTAPHLEEWEAMIENIKSPNHTLKVAVAGKYTQLSDAYLSVIESIRHAAGHLRIKPEITWINTEECTDQDAVHSLLEGIDALIVPGGFGARGIEGKIEAIRYARENHLPYLGLCVGMQCAVIEYARHVIGLEEADSEEFNEQTPHPVVSLMSHQRNLKDKGGTMRLGQYPCHLAKGTKTHQAYRKSAVMERHRHRFEFNSDYLKQFEQSGMVFSGMSPNRELVEVIELPNHPWFVACQYHPEFLSRPDSPHPLFVGLLDVARHLKHPEVATVYIEANSTTIPVSAS